MKYYHLNDKEREELLQSLKAELMNKEDIVFAFLFGSFKDYDDEIGFRDVDIAVYYEAEVKDLLSSALSLADSLSRKHCLPIDCIPINEAPLYFRFRVFRDGMELFCKDESLRDDMIENTLNEALDYMPIRERALRELVA